MADFNINSYELISLYNQLQERKNQFQADSKHSRPFEDKPFDTSHEHYEIIKYDKHYSGTVPVQIEKKFEEVKGDFTFTSVLGTPLVMPVKINGYQLPNEPLVTITGSKKIVKTVLTGSSGEGRIQRRGTVKELISVNDYQIKISGRIVSEKADASGYPVEELKQIMKLYEARKAVTIECALTQLLGIELIAISQISLPGEPGMHNNQRFEITGFSDEDFTVDLLSQS